MNGAALGGHEGACDCSAAATRIGLHCSFQNEAHLQKRNLYICNTERGHLLFACGDVSDEQQSPSCHNHPLINTSLLGCGAM